MEGCTATHWEPQQICLLTCLKERISIGCSAYCKTPACDLLQYLAKLVREPAFSCKYLLHSRVVESALGSCMPRSVRPHLPHGHKGRSCRAQRREAAPAQVILNSTQPRNGTVQVRHDMWYTRLVSQQSQFTSEKLSMRLHSVTWTHVPTCISTGKIA